MKNDFGMVIDYRRYRLRITRTHLFPQGSAALLKLMLQINVLLPSLQECNRNKTIKILTFLGLLMEAYRGIDVS